MHRFEDKYFGNAHLSEGERGSPVPSRSGDVFYKPAGNLTGFGGSNLSLAGKLSTTGNPTITGFGTSQWTNRNGQNNSHQTSLNKFNSGSLDDISEERTEKKKRDVNFIFSSFADTTSLQGPPFIKRAGRWYPQTIWVLILITAFAATTTHLYLVCTSYYSHETTTKISLGHKSLPFPSVSVCNINPIRQNKLALASQDLQDLIKSIKPPKELDPKHRNPPNPAGGGTTSGGQQTPATGSTTGIPNASTQTGSTLPPPSINTPDNATASSPPTIRRKRSSRSNFTAPPRFRDPPKVDGDEEDDALFGESGTVDTRSLQMAQFGYLLSLEDIATRYEMGHEANTFILECAFNGRKCSAENFTVLPPSSVYGNCYTFNSIDARNRSFMARRSGSQYGLDLTLYLQRHEYIAGLSGGAGIRVDIHPFDTLPFMLENGLSAPPGFETQIGLKMLNITRLGGVYGECRGNTVFRNLFNRRYTIDGCLNTCPHRLIAKTCKCYMPEHQEMYPASVLETHELCDYNNETVTDCIHRQERRALSDDEAICNNDCIQPCKELEFEMTMSSHGWPDVGLYYSLMDKVCALSKDDCDKLMSNNDPSVILSSNFVRFKVFYRDLNFETIEQIPAYEFGQFLSDVGGAAGLWVGATFITVFELLDLLVQLITHACKKARSGSVKKSNIRNTPGA